MAKKLTGLNVLAYRGVNAPTPPNCNIFNRAPTTKDYQLFDIGDIWIEKGSSNAWILVDKQQNIATWVDITVEGTGTFENVVVTPGDITVTDGDIHITLGSLYLDNVSEGIAYITDTHDIISLGKADDKYIIVGNTGIQPNWKQVTSTGGTVTITQTDFGLNFEAAGGTAANTYTTDDANVVVPDVGGNVNVVGGVNIGTTGAVANTITINLDNTILVNGDIGSATGDIYATLGNIEAAGDVESTAGSVIANLNVTATTGDITAPGGVITASGDITSSTGHIVSTLGDIVADAGDIEAVLGSLIGGGGLEIGAFSNGVLISDGTGTISSENGTAGYVLTSNGAGVDPSWQSSGISTLVINTIAGVSYTLILSDAGKELQFTSGSAVELTIPTNAAVAFDIGTQIILVQYGAGELHVVPDGGVTLNSCSAMTYLYEQYSAAALIKQDTDVWLLAGDIR